MLWFFILLAELCRPLKKVKRFIKDYTVPSFAKSILLDVKVNREKRNGPAKYWCGISGSHFVLDVSFAACTTNPAKSLGTTVIVGSACTWRHGSHIGFLKQWTLQAMLLYQTNPVWVQLFSYVNTFCPSKLAWLLDTWVHMLYSRDGEVLWLGCTYWIIYRTVHNWRGKTFWQIDNSFL